MRRFRSHRSLMRQRRQTLRALVYGPRGGSEARAMDVVADLFAHDARETCVCTSERRCQYHARLPRPCPACVAANRDGMLQRYNGDEGYACVPCVSIRPLRGEDEIVYRRQSGAIWTCSVCERCEREEAS